MKHVKLLIFIASLLITAFGVYYYFFSRPTEQSIKIGILHSLTGPFAVFEKPIVDATIFAIEEINAQGGILGKKIHYIVKDGKSQTSQFAQEAEHLITQEKVAALFGCWSSPDRKAVKPIVEHYNSLLFYPTQSEGLEDSPNIVYTSTIPNQQ